MKLRLGSIPSSWSWKATGEVIDVRDGTHDTPKYHSEGIPLVTSKNLKPEGIDFENVDLISEEDHFAISKRSRVDAGDILFAMIGTIGNPVVVCDTREFSIKNVALFKCTKSQVDPHYCHRLLDSQLVKMQLEDATRGGTQKFVSLKVLRNLQIPLPPLAEQKRIAGILDAADALLAKRRESLTQLEILLQSTFLDMFGDPVTNPMGWEVYQFSDICGTTQGVQIQRSAQKEEPAEGFERYLYINDLYSDESPKYIESRYPQKRVTIDDLVMANTGSPGRVFKGRPGILSNNLFKVTFDTKKISTIFFYNFLALDRFQSHLRAQMKQGIQSHLGHKTFGRQELPLPPMGLQHRFAAIVESVEQQRASQRAHLAELDTLFASLQSRAFRGDL